MSTGREVDVKGEGNPVKEVVAGWSWEESGVVIIGRECSGVSMVDVGWVCRGDEEDLNCEFVEIVGWDCDVC